MHDAEGRRQACVELCQSLPQRLTGFRRDRLDLRHGDVQPLRPRGNGLIDLLEVLGVRHAELVAHALAPG